MIRRLFRMCPPRRQGVVLAPTLLLATFLVALSAPLRSVGAQEPTPSESDPQAVEAISRYIEAVGGAAGLEAIRDKTLRFDNKKYSPTGVTTMKMARFQKRDYKIREEWELPGMGLTPEGEPLRFLQVYDGEKGWVKAMGYVSALTGKTLTVFVWDKAIDDSFLHWESDGYTARWLGETEIKGRPAHGIELLSFAGGQRVRNYFSAEDGLLLKKEWTENVGNGLTKKEVYYADYVKIPFRDDRAKWIKLATNEQVFEDGELSLEKSFTEIKVNGGLDDKIFGRPEGPAFEERSKDGRLATPESQPKEGGAPTTPPKPAEKPATQPKKKDGEGQ